MSLLHFFIQNNLAFEVLHVNHQTRGAENDYEYKIINEYCQQNEIVLHYYCYTHSSGNFQASAREYRYSLAQKIVAENNLKQIITAHHRDDLVETILMFDQKIDYRGIKEYSIQYEVTLYRPLLSVYKSDIYEYAQKYNVKFNEDYSNSETKYQRNKVRNLKLKQFTTEEKEEIILRELNRIKKMPSLPSCLTVDLLRIYPLDEQLFLLNSFIRKRGHIRIKQNLLKQIIQQMKSEGSQLFALCKNVQLSINYGIFNINSIPIQLETWKSATLGINYFNGIEFDNQLKNVFITSRKDGDRLNVNGINKRVSRLMIEYKIPKELRNQWPIICDKDRNLLYLPKRIEK